MDAEHKRTIRKEIEYWQENKLLPASYCQFLLNLYEEEQLPRRSWFALQSGLTGYVLLVVYVLLLAIPTYFFNNLPLLGQIGVSAAVVLIFYIFALERLKKQVLLSAVLFALGSLLMLLSGVGIMSLNDLLVPFYIMLFVSLCSVTWMVIGLSASIPVFHFVGWVGLALVYGWFLFIGPEPASLWQSQGFWLVPFVMFLLAAWWTRKSDVAISRVLLTVTMLLWLAPEVYDGIVHAWQTTTFITLTTKVIIVAALGYIFRAKWVEWLQR
jgi:hypothetical protein